MKKKFIFIGFILINLTCFSQSIRINEAVSSNSNLIDEDGDSPDWFELYNYGNQTRDYTHINDITNGIKLILDQFENKKIKSIYNIGSGNPIELKKLINELESNFNKKFKVKEIGRAHVRTPVTA